MQVLPPFNSWKDLSGKKTRYSVRRTQFQTSVFAIVGPLRLLNLTAPMAFVFLGPLKDPSSPQDLTQ
jgi:hypothetical protein